MILQEWAEERISLGTSKDWDAAAKSVKLGSRINDANFGLILLTCA
jgi:hypothetical protein